MNEYKSPEEKYLQRGHNKFAQAFMQALISSPMGEKVVIKEAKSYSQEQAELVNI